MQGTDGPPETGARRVSGGCCRASGPQGAVAEPGNEVRGWGRAGVSARISAPEPEIPGRGREGRGAWTGGREAGAAA
jgi:hypothetical protein